MNSQAIGVVTALLAGLAMGVGYAAVVNPLAALGVLTLLVGGAVVWLRPLWGLALMISLIPVEGFAMLGPGATAPRLLGVGVAGAWLLRKLIRNESWDRLIRTPLLVVLALFLAYVALSSLWATVPFAVPNEMFRLGMFVALPILVIDLVRDRHDATLLVKAIVLGGLVAALLTAVQVFGPTYVRRAGEGISGSINETARLLTCLVPLGFYLLRATRFPWSLLGLVYVLLAPVAVGGTLSRTAFLITSVVLAIELAHSVIRGQGRTMILLVGTAGMVILPFVFPVDQLVPRVTERIDTIRPYIESTLDQGDGGIVASSPRGFHIQVAFAIFRDNPWVGAGYRNYPYLFVRDYQARLWGANGYVAPSPKSPHGTLWGFLADLGLIGTGIWFSMIGAAFLGLFRYMYATRNSEVGAPEDRAFARSIILLLVILCGYHLAAEVHLDKLFWMAFGLAAVLPKMLQDDLARKDRRDWRSTAPSAPLAPGKPVVAAAGPAV